MLIYLPLLPLEFRRTFEPRGITAQDTIVFIIGIIPFIWATNEFWRRIVAGESFGTGVWVRESHCVCVYMGAWYLLLLPLLLLQH